jgi:hypothetical protein
MASQKRPAPFSLRLTFKQRAQLEQEAEGMSISAYILRRLFGADSQAPQWRRAPARNQKALAAVLGMLGQSRLANNVNQLAKHANQGTLPVTPETEAMLREAAADIAAMRTALMAALRVDPTP